MSESTDLTVAQANEIVLRIAQSKGWVEPRLREKSDPETLELLGIIASIREELGDAVETIARDIYSRKARFILELIQNAEDNQFTRTKKAPSITFEVHPDKIIVECNEDGFTEANVQSICRTGRSSKKSKRGYVGEKGIGFKSVFQVASKVHIQSNSFSFSFQYNGGTSSEEKLGIVTPIPEDEYIPLGDRPLTRMTLTPIQSIRYEDLLAQFQDIPDTLLLFLSTIKELKIKIHHSDQKVSVITFTKSDDSAAKMINLIKIVEDPDDPEEKVVTEARYYIARKQISRLPADKARLGIDECEVVLAFPLDPLDEAFSPLISTQDVFAFLPIRSFGFSFLIQADFILQASRQDVIDSARNADILTGVAKVFRDAVLDFSRSDSLLRHQWMRFLPSGNGLDKFWGTLPLNIIDLLKQEAILYPYASLEPRQPNDLRTLPISHLDQSGAPLFEDRPGVNRKYLSLQYDSKDIKILRKAFGLQDISDMQMFHRIKQDLDSQSSKLKALDADEDWHSRAADLISSILERSPEAAGRIRDLCLIPLIDGQWVNASENELYFPSESGPEIPRDLVTTIDPRAIRNVSRKKMLTKLGVTRCSTKEVIERVWTCYLRDAGASDLSCSMAHLSYLYWNYERVEDPRFSRLWLYDRNEKKVTSRQKLMYLQSDDEYGPHELFRAIQHPTDPRKSVPECPVPFINPAYMDLFPPSTQRHELSWISWLETALGVRRIPRLKFEGGSLSTEFRHIIKYRPDKVIGTLERHWKIYENDISPAIKDSLSQAEVACYQTKPRVLNSTYLPLPGLKEKVQNLGIFQDFPFLEISDASEERRLLRKWRFLEEFGVGFEDDLHFYVEILEQHEALKRQSWDSEDQDYILKTYESIADHCSGRDKDWLIEQIDTKYLILDPRSFHPGASRPRWIDVESCVWRGPENLLDKVPLASVPQYRNNRTLVRFFRQILGVEDADWNDYLQMLLKLKDDSNSSNDISDKVLRLYHLFLEDQISNEDWVKISEFFEEEALIYMPSTSAWFPPSECLWTSPVQIDGMAIVSNSYPDDLKIFFLERLRISPASLSTLVEELEYLALGDPSVANVKEMIWAINAMEPKRGDLDSLLACSILPVRMLESGHNYNTSFQSCQTDFVIIDRTKLAEIFDGHAAFLDFTLEEVQQLYPFLHALGLEKKYLSLTCHEETACDENGLLDTNLTAAFHQRAYDLLCCAVSYRSPSATKNPRLLYDLLLSTSILKTDGISTQYTLRQTTGDKIVQVPKGYVHVREQESSWQIFVPLNRRDRELCYLRQLPEALSKLFKVAPSAREIIGNVLKSSTSIIDDLLEAAGIGKVSDIQPPLRQSLDDLEEQETVTIEEATSHLRDSRAQSAPLLTSRNSLGQRGSSNRSNLENGESFPGFNDADILRSPISPRGIRASTPSTTASDIRGTPASSGSRHSTPQPSREPANISLGSPSPEDVNQDNYYSYDAYRELLDHVIRIANNTNLPQRDSIARYGDGQFHPGFDHEAAFGIRSQAQMTHDTRIGAAGELFVFEMLLDMSLPSFGRHDWKSTIRKEVRVHPRYSDMEPWSGAETADITYRDVSSAFTTILIQAGYLEDRVWRGACPHYFIEVKTTTGECNDRFFMSNSQYLRMQRMALTPGQAASEVYIIFRVFNLSRDSLNVKVYVDPEAYRQRNELVFEAQSWTVIPRA